jgi:nucleotidyltransferase/DNA polymerase involved in DNA repair
MIACLTVPYFATAVERRKDLSSVEKLSHPGPGSGSLPGLVIGGQPWEPQPLYAFSQEVAKNGVRPGMSLRLAHVLSPQAEFISTNLPHYFSAHGEITDILTDFTNLVEPQKLWSLAEVEPLRKAKRRDLPAANLPTNQPAPLGKAFGRRLPARYTLDLQSLPPVEALPLAQEIGRSVRQHTYLSPAIGLATNRFVAQMAAVLTHPNHARTISLEDEPLFLSAQTIQFLPLQKEMDRRLSLLGIRTLGQFIALPLASLHSQLGLDRQSGREFSQLYYLVKERIQPTGRIGNFYSIHQVQPLATEKQEQIAYYFDDPVNNLLNIERILVRAASELAARLHQAKQETRSLQLILEIDRRQNDPIYNQLSRRQPTADPLHLIDSLRELLHLSWQQVNWLYKQSGSEPGIITLKVILTDFCSVAPIQLSLFEQSKTNAHRLQEILSNLFKKHGSGSFFRPAPADIDHPLLERRYRLLELNPA